MVLDVLCHIQNLHIAVEWQTVVLLAEGQV